MKYIAYIFNIIIGAVFLLSAYFKLYPIEFFEAKLSMFGLSGLTAGVLARVITAFELLLGACLVFQLTFKGRILKITFATLCFFIIINFIDLYLYGNSTNCGCMGMGASITPLQSILKNVILISFVFISLRFQAFSLSINNRWLALAVLLIPFVVVFVLQPVYISENSDMPMKGTVLDFKAMDVHPGLKGKTYREDIGQGKRVVAFLSLTCAHCKMAAFKLTGYKATNPELPVYFILNGDSTDMESFMTVAGGKDIELAHFNGSEDYAKMSGYNLPAIYLVKDSKVEVQFNNGTLNKGDITEWFNKQ